MLPDVPPTNFKNKGHPHIGASPYDPILPQRALQWGVRGRSPLVDNMITDPFLNLVMNRRQHCINPVDIDLVFIWRFF